MKTINEFPKRKRNRLEGFDYSANGSYFVTICIKGPDVSLWQGVGADSIRPDYELIEEIDFPLSQIGKVVETAIGNIPVCYDCVTVDKYCIMPDHIHMIISIHKQEDGRIISAPTISTVVGQMKRWVSKQIGKSVWQKSFNDSIIDSDRVYNEVWEYINNNPRKIHKEFKY
ncbi:MAG: transposase [Clostridia bacterium]|nr:transposase [Clostridia bacterium]